MAITYGGGDTVTFRGTFDVSSGTFVAKTGQISRSYLQETSEAQLWIPLESLLVWDDLNLRLPGVPANDDLGIIEGVWGTNAATIRTSNSQTTSVTQRARFRIPIDNQYIEGQDFKIRLRAGMITTVADSSATIDLEVYSPDGDGGVGTDLCTTAAQSINSLTKGNFDFVVTASGLAHGEMLDCRATIAITDGATGTAVIGELSSIRALRDIRG